MATYYARLKFIQLETVRQDSTRLRLMTADPAFDDAGMMSPGAEFERLCGALADIKETESSASGVMPIDLLLAASRGTESEQFSTKLIDLGAPTARILSPVVVKAISIGLKDVRAEALHESLASALIEAEGHPSQKPSWLTPALTALAALQRFYASAAAYGQYVLIAEM